ncbi:hypothetical protein, partial [Intrasporangium sp.]|uniref:hypothetical protein n=1 Tax=Intrasporangium sp. TaxID=1925024 RepID=UPI00293A6F62
MAEISHSAASAGYELISGPAEMSEALTAQVFPSVTVYNRLEGRPRTRSFERSLRAEVRDPLWLLTRQWQLGEFQADDAGSPVSAQLLVERTELTELGAREAPVTAFDGPLPLEARVERRPFAFRLGGVPLALDLRLALGRRWEKWLAAAVAAGDLSADYTANFREAFEFPSPDPTAASDAGLAAHPGVWQSFAAVAGRRALDGGALFEQLTATPPLAPYDGVTGIAAADEPFLDRLGVRLVEWFHDLVVPAGEPEVDAWDPQRLEYRFRAAAPNADGSARRYAAREYHGGRLDWWHLDLDPQDTTPLDQAAPGVVVESRSATVPSPVSFEGMPATRWWAFEEGRTNLGAVDAATTDLATMLFVEFALVYANDWFLTQLRMPVASIATVRGLAVTNVFGERYWIPPAGSGDDDTWQRWSMFSSSRIGPGEADTSLLVLPVAAKVQEGPAFEEVSLVRDEQANMVWGLERTIPSAAGGGMPGGLAAGQTAAYFQRLGDAVPQPEPDEPRVADVRYEAMSSVPEHWIPFVPVHVDGSNRQIQLQRAALPRIVPGLPTVPV